MEHLFDFVFNRYGISNLKLQIKRSDHTTLIHSLNQLDRILEGYKWIYNFATSTIYIRYIYHYQKRNFDDKEKYNDDAFYQELEELYRIYTQIECLTNNNESLEKDYRENDLIYFINGVNKYDINLDRNIATNKIMELFKQCLEYKQKLINIQKILVNIHAMFQYVIYGDKSRNPLVDKSFYSLSKHNQQTKIAVLSHSVLSVDMDKHYPHYFIRMFSAQFIN